MAGLQRSVEQLYERNRRRGYAEWCEREYDFVCPSAARYPFQWFWDSCFHAIVLSHFDAQRARSEISSLVSQAQPDGLLPHVIFWERERYSDLLRTYNIEYRTPYVSDQVQPPLLPEAIAGVVDADGADEHWLAEVVPPARRHFDWLDRVRDPDQDGLIAILQPDESGLDHSPKYDSCLGVADGPATLEEFDRAWERVAAAHRAVARDPAEMFAGGAFVVEDVLVNTIYAENLEVLARLLEMVGEPEAAGTMSERSRRTRDSLLAKCWDGDLDLFCDLATNAEVRQPVKTVSSLMPIVLADLPRSYVDAIVAQLRDGGQFATPFPVPSVAVDEPSFEPSVVGERLLWRGPTWMNTNWYLVRGLRRHGEAELADHVARRSVELVLRSGFREYYDPFTGEGHGATDFSWSALALALQPSG